MKGGSVEIHGRLLAPHDCCLCEFTEEPVVVTKSSPRERCQSVTELDEGERGEAGKHLQLWICLSLPLTGDDHQAILLPPSRMHTASHWSAQTQNHTEKELTTEQNYAD